LVLGVCFGVGDKPANFVNIAYEKLGRPWTVSSFKGNVIFFWQAGTIWANHRDLVEAGF